MHGWKQRACLDLECSICDLCYPARDSHSVHLFESQSLQNQQIERALQKICSCAGHSVVIDNLDEEWQVSCRLSIGALFSHPSPASLSVFKLLVTRSVSTFTSA